MSRALIVMGPSGSGKTTVGTALARRLGWRFVEGDSFHSVENRSKMAAGTPLTDEDRLPWLVALAKALHEANEKDDDLVLACSALKESYRRILHVHDDVSFVYLDVPTAVLAERVQKRKGHFIDPSILKSQLDALEPPTGGVTVDATKPVADVIEEIAERV